MMKTVYLYLTHKKCQGKIGDEKFHEKQYTNNIHNIQTRLPDET